MTEITVAFLVQPWAWIGDDGATTLGYRRMNNWRKK
jgi:hypothetical protein